MKRAGLIGIILAAALAVTVPSGLAAQQGQQGKGMGPGMGMGHPMGMGPGMGMMHGSGMHYGMGPGMGMMMGTGPWAGKLSDADRGELLVLKGRMMKKHAELTQRQAEAMIAEGERLQKGGK